MSDTHDHDASAHAWPALISAALRVAFGLIWAVDAALTWTPQFAVHYVGYLHNAAQGQAAWSAWWYAMWIAIVTPHAGVFILLTRLAETALALALLFGFARKTTYVAGALFSLLIWSTAEGFGGPYAVGATNMGAGIAYVLIFIALIAINYRGGTSPYSIDYLIERRWPAWRRIAEWSAPGETRVAAQPVSWRIQGPVLIGIAVLAFFLIAGFYSTLNVKGRSDLSPRTLQRRLTQGQRAAIACDRPCTRRFVPLFMLPKPDSPDSGHTYPAAANRKRRAIHRLPNANRVVTCAPFLASPR